MLCSVQGAPKSHNKKSGVEEVEEAIEEEEEEVTEEVMENVEQGGESCL